MSEEPKKRKRSDAHRKADKRYQAKNKTIPIVTKFSPEELAQIDGDRGEETRHAYMRRKILISGNTSNNS